MRTAAAAVKADDMSDMEAMLVAQTMSLNVIYAELAQRASRNLGTNIEVADTPCASPSRRRLRRGPT